MLDLLIGTADGIFLVRRQKGLWEPVQQSLRGQDIRVIARHPNRPHTLFAGSYGSGLLRSIDDGAHWSRVGAEAGIEYVRAVAFAPGDPERLYVGTEPAYLYRSHDGGDSWTELNIRSVDGSESWSLPYSPRAGAVRTIVLDPEDVGHIYAGVEQGGVLESNDDGESWTISGDEIHPDIHQLAIHPLDTRILFAATGGGLYVTKDRAHSWDRLVSHYTRAVFIHPLNPGRLFAGPARQVGHGGRILLSEDGGDSWEVAAKGLTLPMQDMVETFTLDPNFPNHLFAIRSSGTILLGRVDEVEWQPLQIEVPAVHSLLIGGNDMALNNPS